MTTFRDDVVRSIGRLEGKVDGIAEDVKEIKALTERVRKVENKQAWTAGVMATLTTLFAAVISYFKLG